MGGSATIAAHCPRSAQDCKLSIATGLAVVSERIGRAKDRTPVGKMPNLAARLQLIARQMP